jgi:hypothetical protein
MAIEAKHFARVVELVYTHDSKSCAARLVGSSPTSGTSNYHTHYQLAPYIIAPAITRPWTIKNKPW